VVDISTEMVKELRERTGAGILDSKKALQETQGDIQRAVDLLRERGLARAAKKVGREAKEGLIEAYLSPDALVGVLVEVNCETDFVARTPDFKALAHEVAEQVARANPPYNSPLDLPLGSRIHEAISRLGENIQVRRFTRYDQDGRNSVIDTYTHGGGSVAVMLELEADSANAAQSPEFKTLAHELALQIAAQNPRYVTSADVPQDVLESERSAYRAQLVEEKKPANIVDRIIEGKLQKFYADVCLMDQPSIRDDKQKVQTLVTSAAGQAGCDIRVRRFVRYALGD
jgi:elongation factor Ts